MDNPLIHTPTFYPIVIIGGGIVGAGIFRELSLHKIPCLLIDKRDFSGQTSQSSSKMLHGGIRYLENFDFRLVKEALQEKNHWLKTAPHLCYQEDFYIPVFKDDKRPLWMIKAGLWFYDALSGFQNKPHSSANIEKTLQAFPELKKEELQGSGIYSDAIVDDAKLTLEVIYDGLCSNESEALNYIGLEQLKKENGIWKLTLKDQLTNQQKEITTQEIIFSTGPFTDQLFEKLKAFPWEPKLLPSKGSHLWLKEKALNISNPMVLTPKDGRVIFVIPQRERILVGTTEVPVQNVEFDLKPSQAEINYLIENLQNYFPRSKVTQKDILGYFAGIRPLIRENLAIEANETARDHKIYQPAEGIHVILGGKYTTFRLMASDLVAPLIRKFKISYNPQLSRSPLRVKSTVTPFQKWNPNQSDIDKIIQNEKPRTNQDIIERRLGILNVDLKGLKLF